MSRRTPHYRMYALACMAGLALIACSGGGNDVTAPDPGPPPVQDPPPAQDPPPPPAQDAGITGNYALVRINDSQPGQLVTISNPDGSVIGLYRFDASTQLYLAPLQTFNLRIHYTDDKEQFDIDDRGEFKPADQSEGVLPLSFDSEEFGDSFLGVATEGLVSIKYDLDGDGQLDTFLYFVRATG